MSGRIPRSLQPLPATPPAPQLRRPTTSPRSPGPTGPDNHSVPADGDHRGASSVDVGADFFTAAELAALKLPGLPQRREHVSRLASKRGWTGRARQGKGGGREFPLSALPAEARAEILRRRVVEATTRNDGTSRPDVPLVLAANLKARQAERLSARKLLLVEFDRFKGGRSDRAVLEPFVAAVNAGHVVLPAWSLPFLGKLSPRTIKRWLAARRAGRTEGLVDRYSNCGAKSVFDQSPELKEFVVGAHSRQPLLRIEGLAALLPTRFPEGVPDRSGLMLPLPSAATVGRFLKAWKNDPLNRAVFTALNDPDRYRSKFRFAVGDAAAGVTRPNQRWQIDASPADRMFLDGRTTIYVLVDVFSRRIIASASKTPRTVGSLLLIARACQAWGMPEEIWTDNGSDFTSRHFVMAMNQLGVHHHVTRPFSPEEKSFVERAIGTIQSQFMPLFDDYAGRNVAQRAQIEGRRSFAQRLGEEAKALLGASSFAGDLQDQLTAWIANVYERRPHSGLGGRRPIEMWEEGTRAHPPKYPPLEALGLLLMPPATGGTRVVTRKGISVDGIDYIGADLDVGRRVHVRLDPDDVGRIWVYTDEDPWRFLCVASNPELEGLNRAEMAARIRALQAATIKAGKGELRRLERKADVHAVARRMIGEAPVGGDRPDNVTYLTPALEEAARAVVARRMPAPARPFLDTASFDAPVPEEQPHERYARWKQLKALADAGAEIPADQADWLHVYPTTPQWRAHRMADPDANDSDDG